MNNIFENSQRLPVCEYKPPEFSAVDLTIFIQGPGAEFIQNRLITWRTPRDDAMREGIRINRVCSKMFQHAAHNAFTGRDITCQTDYIFSWPIAHRNSNAGND